MKLYHWIEIIAIGLIFLPAFIMSYLLGGADNFEGEIRNIPIYLLLVGIGLIFFGAYVQSRYQKQAKDESFLSAIKSGKLKTENIGEGNFCNDPSCTLNREGIQHKHDTDEDAKKYRINRKKDAFKSI